jgi:hypothetical protein
MKKNQVCSNKTPNPLSSSKGRQLQKCKIGVGSFKSFLLQNYWANFNQIFHRLSLGKRDSSFSNEGDNSSPRGKHSKIVKIH